MLPGSTAPRSLAGLLVEFRPCFTAPTFQTFIGLVVGLVAQTRRRTVCGMLTGAGLDQGAVAKGSARCHGEQRRDVRRLRAQVERPNCGPLRGMPTRRTSRAPLRGMLCVQGGPAVQKRIHRVVGRCGLHSGAPP